MSTLPSQESISSKLDEKIQEENGRFVILLAEQSPETLYHELAHLLQVVNGLNAFYSPSFDNLVSLMQEQFSLWYQTKLVVDSFERPLAYPKEDEMDPFIYTKGLLTQYTSMLEEWPEYFQAFSVEQQKTNAPNLLEAINARIQRELEVHGLIDGVFGTDYSAEMKMYRNFQDRARQDARKS